MQWAYWEDKVTVAEASFERLSSARRISQGINQGVLFVSSACNALNPVAALESSLLMAPQCGYHCPHAEPFSADDPSQIAALPMKRCRLAKCCSIGRCILNCSCTRAACCSSCGSLVLGIKLIGFYFEQPVAYALMRVMQKGLLRRVTADKLPALHRAGHGQCCWGCIWRMSCLRFLQPFCRVQRQQRSHR